jgi:exosome complex component RRP42
VKIDEELLVDPTAIEEMVADARLTVTTDTNGNIRAMQKGLSGAFSYDEISTAIDGSIRQGNDIREKIFR